MKKSLLWVMMLTICISLVALFGLGGCKPAVEPIAEEAAPDEEEVVEEVPPAEETEAEVVAEKILRFDLIGPGSAGDPAWAIVKQGMDDAAAFLGVEAVIYFSGGATPDQMAAVDGAVAAGSDGVGVWIYDPAVGEVVQKAIDAGIPAVQLGVKLPEWTDKGLGSVALGSLYDTGVLLGEWLSPYIEDGSHILISAELPGLEYAEGRKNGILAALDEAGIEYTYEYLDAGYEIATAEERISSYMVAHPELDVAIGVGGVTTERTAVSAKALGYEPGDILISGWDPMPETVAGIESEYVKGVGLDPRYLEGFFGIVVLYTMAQGLPPSNVVLNEIILDINNLDILESPQYRM